MNWTSFGIGGLAVPVIGGLAAYLGRLFANKILARDRAKYQTQMETLLADMRTADEKELFVHRLQFETEFGVYKELWDAALRTAKAGRHFRSLGYAQVPVEEAMTKEIIPAHTYLSETVFSNRPFYEPRVYDLAKSMCDLLSKIVTQWHRSQRLERQRHTDPDKLNDIDMNIEQILDQLNEHLDKLCQAIRDRIWSTTASAWDRPKAPPDA
jgi:hypothetical protein